MSYRVDSAQSMFAWLNAGNVPYVVLRDFEQLARLAAASRRPGDIDLLIDDAAIPAFAERFGRRRSRRDVKVDVYGVRGGNGSAYLGFPHLPVDLGERMLARRVPHEDRFHVPEAHDHLLGLLYHHAYHKNEQSGIHWRDPARSRASEHHDTLARLIAGLGLDLPLTHRDFHDYLVKAGAGVAGDRLIAYIQRDFRYGRKVYFHAWLQDRLPGEMNLFVIRRTAVKHDRHADLLGFLGEHFDILVTKDIPFRTRVRERKRLRGGKWRRGGFPVIAVVVFDHDPVPTDEEDRKAHPFVFNRNQFVKQGWREWFLANSRARRKDNPIHSTDNEAEAIGHLPLFFSGDEQADLFARTAALRGGVDFEALARAGD